MTCKEKLMQEHPEHINPIYYGGCWECPSSYGYMDDPEWCANNDETCTKCWNREIPEKRGVELAAHTIAHPIVVTDENGNKHPVMNHPLTDAVNHPSHYNHGGMECIDEMVLIFGIEATMHFCLLNAWKYRYRAIHKNGEEDMEKADWYIAKYQQLKEGIHV